MRVINPREFIHEAETCYIAVETSDEQGLG